MLPKPKNSVTVGANKNKVFSREVNRPLVPHTLTKQKPVDKHKPPDKTNVKVVVSGEESENDSEDEEVSTNFFSFGEKPSDTVNVDTVKKAESFATSIVSSVPTPNPKTVNLNESVKTPDKPSKASSTNANTKDNSFFANLFGKGKESKTSGTKSANKIERTSIIDKNISSSTTSIQNNPTKNLQTSYGVTAPYGANTGQHNSGVTAPYESNVSAVTAPYESGVTAAYGGVTAPYGSNLTPSTGSYSTIQQQQHDGGDNNFFSYSHETTTAHAVRFQILKNTV